MIFVGREREVTQVAEALARGRNVVVSGLFGTGRTALLHHVAKTLGGDWRFAFADFERPPAEICAQLLEGLGGRLPGESRDRRRRRPAAGRSGYLAVRAALLRTAAAGPRPAVLVLDNAWRVSAAKSALLRALAAAERFRFAVVIERFLPAADRARLGAWLEPASRISLGRLDLSASTAFFSQFAAAHRIAWSPAEIDGLARAAAGYPLSMQELAWRELDRAAAETAAFQERTTP